jgi:hypothetical protein
MITSVVGLFLILGIAYYSVRLLRTFRTGILEKSWRAIAISGLFLTSAQIAYFLQALEANAMILIDAGIIFDILGSLFLLAGLRTHLKTWLLGNAATTAYEEKSREQILT